ncbi:acyl-CoA dehydrogenase family protein [Puniceibacterium sp. IMCC21224]|uniref:acyl-CoA dehydrogenase family protein n=1 Tax=Puniceibacterium sp. IMCC21224 TaxID=1618204 RepID=UPI00064D87A9|nr:acyl-CoA dehydrogenase family protein [Puniceibacterium sp. IMCC21224]KMK66552.1 acyl-CoA dehydrogenase [Puniceibacterium sp. IMCC21224]
MYDLTHDQQARTLSLLAQTTGWARVRTLCPEVDDSTAQAILSAAGTLAETVIQPLDSVADRDGCRLTEGRVQVPAAYSAAYRAVADGGWIGIDLPESMGGSGLPIVLQAAAEPLFDRASIAFNMATGASRAAAVLLSDVAPSMVAADWVPALIAGTRTATICISEPDAGSDVGRIQTLAQNEGGIWRITGQKCWISFGDHDMTDMIGHCILARTSDMPGTRGLSLFLCPSVHNGAANGITCLRIEEKMGLHGSPTCTLEFDGAHATLLGEEGRGVPALFKMIELMRLQTGCQGLGAATRACDIAEGYAQDRLQGGPPNAPPISIARHPDVARRLLLMRSQTELLRAATLELACTMDIARRSPHPQERDNAAALSGFLLPLIKNFGAETGFEVANQGMLVLGGAGYTREWPLEQIVRDIRVAAIYEGTTGIQALDFLERRLIRDHVGFDVFSEIAAACDLDLGLFAKMAERLIACDDPERRQRAADAWFRIGWLMVTAWLSPRLAPNEARCAMLAWAERMSVHAAQISDALDPD